MNIEKSVNEILKKAVDINPESFTGYEKLKQKFNYKGIKIGSYDVEQSGDDFEGFEVEIEGILSNGLEFSWNHDNQGQGEFKVRTRKKTELYKDDFDLKKAGYGYSEVLESYLKSILDFNF